METLKFFKKFPCVWALWCGVESLLFFKVPLCVGSVVWCKEFDFFKVPMCVDAVLWWEDVELLSDFPRCAYCASVDVSTVVERLLTFQKKSLCWGFFPCGGEIYYFRKNPCAGGFFGAP